MLLISMACIIPTFDVRPAKDENDSTSAIYLVHRPVSSVWKFPFAWGGLNRTRFSSETLDFKVSITPRSDAGKALILKAASA